SGATDDPDTLVINNSTEPQTLDPGIEKGQPEYRVTITLFEGLTIYDPKDLAPKPGVAERWDVSPDASVYTFKLRDAKWSNGEPIRAADFEWSWKRVLDPKLASEYVEQISNYLKNAKAYYDGATADGTLGSWAGLKPEDRAAALKDLPAQVRKRHVGPLKKLLETEKEEKTSAALRQALEEAPRREDVSLDQVGVKATDERTLVVTLETPVPYFLDLAAFFTYFPVHRGTVEKHGSNWTRPGTLVGNGPYRLKEWKVKEHILVEKNPHYWDAANVKDQKIKFLPIENASTAFNLYEKGKIHWLTEPPREYIEELLKRPDYHTGPFLATYFYGFNVTRGPAKDKRVRQALALAVDREQIVKYITRAGEAPARSLVPPILPGYTPSQMPAYDPAAAKRLLAEAGFPEGKGFPKMELLYNTSEAHKKVAATIQEMWRKDLGIEVELRNTEWKVYLDMQSKLEFDVIRRGWISDYNDPMSFLDMFTSKNGNNNTGFSSGKYDALISQARVELDASKRLRTLAEAEAVLMDELPILPLYFYVTKNLWRPRVAGPEDNIRDTHPLNRVHLAGQAP
ncbi:MAG TPA: peptide ABC transporter substrate-binding protein, partial [Planctomycetota bacterium]|nr:peptide ABC transporter substrate-binding protein [Planctomycetota bacterium]